MQRVCLRRADYVLVLDFPGADAEVIHGVKWGRAEEVLSPAFWAVRSFSENSAQHAYISAGSSLAEEVAFCLLGGFGISAELATAYFTKLRAQGAFEPNSSQSERDLRQSLLEPVDINGRRVRYRFPAQRARRLATALPVIQSNQFCAQDSFQLRASLMSLEGIGPKTASWIVRNWLGCDDVAILDIHVVRACQFFGLFPENVQLPKQYDALEARFIEFANALKVRPSVLDAVIWSEMRTFTPSLLTAMG